MATNLGSFLIKDTRVFTGEEVIENASVHVEGDKIVEVGKEISWPQDLPVVSLPNHTLLPGLIDAHIHTSGGQVLAIEQSLNFGVTTVLDMMCEPRHVASLKQISKTTMNTADFKSSSYAATIEGGWPAPVMTALDKSEEVYIGS